VREFAQKKTNSIYIYILYIYGLCESTCFVLGLRAHAHLLVVVVVVVVVELRRWVSLGHALQVLVLLLTELSRLQI
jgi:hypothetical protein